MFKLIFAALFLYLCLKCDTLKTEETIGIETVDYHVCKNVDYAPIICIKYGEKYYGFSDIHKATWYEAVHDCRRNHGNLLTIESAAEMKAISDFLSPERRRTFGVWTAGNDLVNDGEFMSVGNGRALVYTNWATNQPGNANNRKHCVQLEVENNKFAMFNANCKQKFAYICELNTTIPNRVEYN